MDGINKGVSMHSMPTPKPAEAHEALFAHADEALARAYEQITSADEELARMHEKVSRLEHDATHRPSEPQIPVNAFRPAVRRDRPALRGLIGLLLATCIGGAAIASQSSEAAKLMIARWVPQPFASTPSLPLPAQPGPSAVQVAAAEPVSPSAQTASPSAQTAPAAQIAPQEGAPTAGGLASPELAQLLQAIMRDLTNVEQEIEQLKANQQQMASDNANATEQLKASQEQMARVIAKISEQNLRPKTPGPPSHPIATPARKPVAPPPSPQARTQQ
jgi:hypothetical protein